MRNTAIISVIIIGLGAILLFVFLSRAESPTHADTKAANELQCGIKHFSILATQITPEITKSCDAANTAGEAYDEHAKTYAAIRVECHHSDGKIVESLTIDPRLVDKYKALCETYENRDRQLNEQLAQMNTSRDTNGQLATVKAMQDNNMHHSPGMDNDYRQQVKIYMNEWNAINSKRLAALNHTEKLIITAGGQVIKPASSN